MNDFVFQLFGHVLLKKYYRFIIFQIFEIIFFSNKKLDFKELQKSAKDLDKSSEDEEVLAKLSASEIQIPTPDDWVERSVQLQRLTGPFPLNAETPTSTLLKYGKTKQKKKNDFAFSMTDFFLFAFRFIYTKQSSLCSKSRCCSKTGLGNSHN